MKKAELAILEKAELARQEANQRAMEKAQAQAQEKAQEKANSAAKARLANAIRENQDSLSEPFALAILNNWIEKEKAQNKAQGKARKSEYGRNKASIGGYFDNILCQFHKANPSAPMPSPENLIAFAEKINMPIPMDRRKHFGSHFNHWQGSHNSYLPAIWRRNIKG